MKPPKRIALCGNHAMDGGYCCHEVTRDEPAYEDEHVYIRKPKPRKRKKEKP